MIYILIISLLIKKPFYLLRRQSFSFEIVSEFSNFMSRGGAFDSLFCPGGRVFVHNYCPGGRVFAPFESCPGGGMVLDEIDTCITKFQGASLFRCGVLSHLLGRGWKTPPPQCLYG